jgi:murein tripeptide amidase MpaA
MRIPIYSDWMTVMVAVNLIHELADHAYMYEEILAEIEFVVIASANPDGHEYSHTTVSFSGKSYFQI